MCMLKLIIWQSLLIGLADLVFYIPPVDANSNRALLHASVVRIFVRHLFPISSNMIIVTL